MALLPPRPLPITDDRARLIVTAPVWTELEPEPGSIVLVNGEWGCAWQRQFDDGLWRSCRGRGGRGRDWAYMLARRNLVLIYDAPVRPEGER